MFEFKDNGEFIEVYGWDAFNGDDEKLFGAIRKNNDDGYHWYHPARKIKLSCKMMCVISDKLSELNING